MTANTILLRRGKLLVPEGPSADNARLSAAFSQDLQNLGYVLAPETLQAISTLNLNQLTALHAEVTTFLKGARGVQGYRPMYPNFPQQVLDASDAELYINALLHYFSAFVSDVTGADVIWLPKYAKNPRTPLTEKVALQVLRLGTPADLRMISTHLSTANTSLSSADKQDLQWLIAYGFFDLPAVIPNKENAAIVAAALLQQALVDYPPAYDIVTDLSPLMKTATDVLRLAVALSDGDVSLAKSTKFPSLSRPIRRVLLGLLEQVGPSRTEDMQRFSERWLRLGKHLHPGEAAKVFPLTAASFAALRAGQKVQSFNAKVEQAVRGADVPAAVGLLSTRPGEYARRLDQLLRTPATRPDLALEGFESIAAAVSTPVLLQVASHFQHRAQSDLRVIFPKGNTAKVRALKDVRPEIDESTCAWASDICNTTLENRFASLPPLGSIYVDPALAHYTVPFSQRSASRGLRRLERGSKIQFAQDKNTLRFFIWWKQQPDTRTDLDLSAIMYDGSWNYKQHISYFNLRAGQRGSYSAIHSGDITDAPQGACEFIDIDLPSIASVGARYVAMCVNSFTRQHFNTLNECAAGWMLRSHPSSGEVFEPKTVLDKIDVASDSTMVMPLVIDVAERRIIWADTAISSNIGHVNNIAGNYDSITLIGRALTELRKPNLYDLFTLHARARGTLVESPEHADVVFSVETGTPFELERIASEFLANAHQAGLGVTLPNAEAPSGFDIL